MAKFILSAAFALALAGCGGGSADAPSAPAAAPAAAPASAPAPTEVVTAPAPPPAASAPAPAPKAAIKAILLFGDSTAWQDGPYWQLRYPDMVDNEGVPGTTSGQLIAGSDGQHAPWPAPLATVDDSTLVDIKFGANDCLGWFNTTVDSYKDNLRTLVAGVRAAKGTPILETPNPTLDVNRSALEPAYTQAMREVAAELSVTLIDTDACWKARPGGWANLLGPDTEHATEEGRAFTVNSCVAPVIDQLLAR